METESEQWEAMASVPEMTLCSSTHNPFLGVSCDSGLGSQTAVPTFPPSEEPVNPRRPHFPQPTLRTVRAKAERSPEAVPPPGPNFH